MYSYFYCCSITVVPIVLHYSPLPFPTPSPTFNPPPTPLSLFLGPLYSFLDWTLPLLSHYPPPHPPPVPVSLFFISMSLVHFAHLFVLLIRFHIQVRSYGLYFTSWLISFSIMLSSSIHAIGKGRNSFFLSAV